jgi:hypothetical protein
MRENVEERMKRQKTKKMAMKEIKVNKGANKIGQKPNRRGTKREIKLKNKRKYSRK